MDNPGLYVIDENKYASRCNWHLAHLCYNGKYLSTVSKDNEDGNQLKQSGLCGLCVDNSNKELILHGELIAKSASILPSTQAISDNGASVKFGNDVVIHSERCINITLADFNALAEPTENKVAVKSIVEGYKKYDPDAVYNIVTDVTNAPNVEYTPTEYDLSDPLYCKHYIIYNNVAGLNVDPQPITQNDFTSLTTPHLGFHYYKHTIKKEDSLHLQFHVDTRDMQWFNENTLGETFTTTIQYEDDAVIYKDSNNVVHNNQTSSHVKWQKTTYAGIIRATIDAPEDGWVEGEHWFSIHTVDSHGVSSPMQYCYFKVTNAVEEEIERLTDKNNDTNEDTNQDLIYVMKDTDLAKFNIKPNDDGKGNNGDITTPYRNKIGLSLLFAAVKNSGYSGIKLYNSGNDIYYVDYRRNILSAGSGYDAGRELSANIFDTITLANASPENIKNINVNVGEVLFFVLTITNVNNTPDSAYNDASRYVATNMSGVFYDKTNSEFIVNREYKIAPFIPGHDVNYVEGLELYTSKSSESNVTAFQYFNGHNNYKRGPLGMSIPVYDFYGNYSATAGLKYTMYDCPAIINAVDSSTDAFKINNNSVTVPTNKDVAEWLYTDPLKLHRNSNDKIIVHWAYGEYNTQAFGDWLNGTARWDGYNTNNYVFDYAIGSSNCLRVNPTYKHYGKITASCVVDGVIKSISIDACLKLGIGSYYFMSTNTRFEDNGIIAGNPIKYPSDFTIDMNNVVLHATNTEYVSDAGSYGIINLASGSKNVHIKNGEIDGNMAKHNFIKSHIITCGQSRSLAAVNELLKAITAKSPKYCSFENLKIHDILGYTNSDGWVSGGAAGSKNWYDKMTTVGFIDYTGTTKTIATYNNSTNDCNVPYLCQTGDSELNSPCTASEYDISDNVNHAVDLTELKPAVDLVCASAYIQIPNSSSVYAKHIMLSTGHEVRLQVGKRPELFIHFYGDNSYNFIKTIKTHFYYPIMIPQGAKYFKITAYGISTQISDSNTNREVRVVRSASGTYCPIAFPAGSAVDYDGATINLDYKDITWHNTATACALANGGKGFNFINNKFHRISRMRRPWSANGYAIDVEETFYQRDSVSYINCEIDNTKYVRTNNDSDYVQEDGAWADAKNTTMQMYATRNFTFAGNRGFSFQFTNMPHLGYFANNDILRVENYVTSMYTNPCMIFVDNAIGEYQATDDNFQTIEGDTHYFRSKRNQSNAKTSFINSSQTWQEPKRTNRSDDPYMYKIPVFGSFIGLSQRDGGSAIRDNSNNLREGLTGCRDAVNIRNGSAKRDEPTHSEDNKTAKEFL